MIGFRPGAPRDDRGRAVPPEIRRIVSLVPSDTFTLCSLGVGARLVGRTRYCVEPAGELSRVADVGGTKDPDLDLIAGLTPDLVVMNQEENTEQVCEELEARGLRVFATIPKRLADGVALVARLALVLGKPTEAQRELVKQAYEVLRLADATRSKPKLRAFCPIWNDPWMTVRGDTFISDMLDHLGCENVFAGRSRKFPLRADLGEGPELPAEKTEGRDKRYPRVSLAEIEQAQPELVLLPDEPHAFTEEDAAALRVLDIPAAKTGRIHLVRGRYLMWPGLMSVQGFSALRSLVAGEPN